MIRPLAAFAAIALAAGGAPAQQHYQSSPERRTVTETRDFGEWGGPFRAKLIPSMMQDFGERYLYASANSALAPPRAGETRVVFMGDSITDMWNLAEAFPGKPYVNRGVGAQVTAQMMLRFRQDVVALRPAAVVILAGTNDVTGFLQQETPDSIVANIATMGDIADAHGIRVVIASIVPVNNYTDNARDMLKDRPPELLRSLNAKLAALARCRGYVYADYASVMTDKDGMLERPLAEDGLHPNAAGYARMKPVVSAAIATALGSRPPKRGSCQGE